MATLKKRFKTNDEYIASFPKDVRAILEEYRQIIKETAPGSEETISYGMPAFKIKGKGLVYFAAWKNHVGFYPGAEAIETFKKQLSPFKQAKGSIQFPCNEPIPTALVKEIVQFRTRELNKKGSK